MPDRAAQSVEPPDEKNVTTAKLFQTGIEARPMILGPRCLVREDQISTHSRLQQCVALKGEILILRAYASISHEPGAIRDRDHTSPRVLQIRLQVNIGKTARLAPRIALLHAESEILGRLSWYRIDWVSGMNRDHRGASIVRGRVVGLEHAAYRKAGPGAFSAGDCPCHANLAVGPPPSHGNIEK